MVSVSVPALFCRFLILASSLMVLAVCYTLSDMASRNTKAKKKVKKKVTTPKNKGGRPTLYTKALAEEICQRISTGESLLKICRDDHMPTRATIHNWILATNEDGTRKYQWFFDNYALAMEMRADVAFDEINEIADETPEMVRKTAEKKSGAMANAQRLRVDARKWTAARMFPKKYSDRHVVTTEDKDGNTMPIAGNVIQFAPQDKN